MMKTKMKLKLKNKPKQKPHWFTDLLSIVVYMLYNKTTQIETSAVWAIVGQTHNVNRCRT